MHIRAHTKQVVEQVSNYLLYPTCEHGVKEMQFISSSLYSEVQLEFFLMKSTG